MKRLGWAAVWFAVSAATSAMAQEAYPSRPVTWVVPYAAGAPADIAFRKIAEGMTGPLGATIVVMNRPGAAATIGTTEVAKAKPDGYTILATLNDPLVSLVALMDPLPYDPAKDFTFITKLTQSKAAMIAGPHIKARTLRELIEEAKATPNGMAYGSFGVGSFPHIIMEALGRRTGAKFINVNYRGSPQAIQELLSGQIGVTFGAAAAMQYIKEGKIKLIVQLGEERGLLADVPTFTESGFNDVLLTTPLWSGLAAPAGTPRAAVDKLVTAAKIALDRKDVQDFLVAIAFEKVGNSPEEFTAQWRKEYETIPAAIKSLGITAN